MKVVLSDGYVLPPHILEYNWEAIVMAMCLGAEKLENEHFDLNDLDQFSVIHRIELLQIAKYRIEEAIRVVSPEQIEEEYVEQALDWIEIYSQNLWQYLKEQEQPILTIVHPPGTAAGQN